MEEIPGGSADKDLAWTRKEIFLIMQDWLKSKPDDQIQHLEEKLSEKSKLPVTIREGGKLEFLKLFHKMRKMWQESSRNAQFFFRKHEEWLNNLVHFPIPATTTLETSKNKGGRPSTEFTSCSDRSKRRRTEQLRATCSTSELSYATQMSLRSSGKLDAATVVKDVTITSPTRGSKYRKAFESVVETTLSEDAALSIMVEAKMTKHQYKIIRESMKDNKCKLYPPYRKVAEAKLRCYPLPSAMRITESSAEVGLQDSLDHTTERILCTQNEVIKSLAQEEVE